MKNASLSKKLCFDNIDNADNIDNTDNIDYKTTLTTRQHLAQGGDFQ